MASGFKSGTCLRGGIFLLGLLLVLLISRLVNPSYPFAPVVGVLSAAIVLQPLCYSLLRQPRLLAPIGWLFLGTDALVVAVVLYFTSGAGSIFLWVFLPIALLAIWLGTYLSSIQQRDSSKTGYLEGVQAFVQAVEAKDPHTKGHSERVAHYAVLIARELGLKRKEVELIREAGLVHDVGKIFLPEEVLTARGTLEPAQQAAMMSHPLHSYEVLEKSSAPKDILLAVRHHHEWYGGGGYPDGLRGQDIPLAARILAMADAFEAMTAGRFYRARRSIAEATEELCRVKGTQLEPKVVDAFLRRLKKEEVPTRLPEEVPAPAELQGPKVPLARRELPWTQGMMTATQYKALTLLFRLGQEVRSILDRNTIMTKVLSLLKEVTGYDNCALFLKEETGDLVMQAAIGYRIHQRGARVAKGEGVIGWVAEHNVARLIPDVTANSGSLESSFLNSGTMLAAPLSAEGKVVAVLVVENEITDAFTIEDVHLAEAVGPYIATVIEVALLHEQAKSAAFYDSLTGVYNHRYFYERLGQEMARSQRYGHPLSIAIIDIDGLKKINDRYGHLAGDEALRRIGHILKENARPADAVARYGGDEFAIIMPQTGKEDAEKVMTRLMRLLDTSTVQHEDLSFPVPSRSWGVAAFPDDGKSATELFAVADVRLYQYKGQKRSVTNN